MTPVETLIERFSAVFGEPRTENPDLFLAEYARLLAPFSAAAVQRAADELLKTAVYWPRPAEAYAAANKAAAEIFRATRPPEPPPETEPPDGRSEMRRARVAAMVRGALGRMKAAADGLDKQPVEPVSATRDDMRAMQAATRNNHLHTTGGN